ncbi:hypothetical protein PVAR5_5989 [Paecilomyces variotii No. 5]|uniref:Uncharacterized protein n=1 Tax=Byssochlamys spectabilis (strain No. 5 / NBRC 109023) TaxID=1356009 RepID=V5I2U4_BYSSN|nr:hypothetical protein PVAR5_5989 [Paecilomyces variotii No. 5]
MRNSCIFRSHSNFRYSLIQVQSKILELSPPPSPDSALSDLEYCLEADLLRAVRVAFSFFTRFEVSHDKGEGKTGRGTMGDGTWREDMEPLLPTWLALDVAMPLDAASI